MRNTPARGACAGPPGWWARSWWYMKLSHGCSCSTHPHRQAHSEKALHNTQQAHGIVRVHTKGPPGPFLQDTPTWAGSRWRAPWPFLPSTRTRAGASRCARTHAHESERCCLDTAWAWCVSWCEKGPRGGLGMKSPLHVVYGKPHKVPLLTLIMPRTAPLLRPKIQENVQVCTPAPDMIWPPWCPPAPKSCTIANINWHNSASPPQDP